MANGYRADTLSLSGDFWRAQLGLDTQYSMLRDDGAYVYYDEDSLRDFKKWAEKDRPLILN